MYFRELVYLNISIWAHSKPFYCFFGLHRAQVTKTSISETENLMSFLFPKIILTNAYIISVLEILGTRHQKDCQEIRKVISIQDSGDPIFHKGKENTDQNKLSPNAIN